MPHAVDPAARLPFGAELLIYSGPKPHMSLVTDNTLRSILNNMRDGEGRCGKKGNWW